MNKLILLSALTIVIIGTIGTVSAQEIVADLSAEGDNVSVRDDKRNINDTSSIGCKVVGTGLLPSAEELE